MQRSVDIANEQKLQAEIEGWVAEHQVQVWRYLRYLGCPAQQAEDLAQDTFLAALRQGAAELPPSQSRAYLRRTAANFYRMQLRQQGRQVEVRADQAEVDRVFVEAEAEDAGAGYREALGHCLDQLAPRSRRALEECYREGADRGAVAQALQLSVEGLKTLLRRCREQLRRCIERSIAAAAAAEGGA